MGVTRLAGIRVLIAAAALIVAARASGDGASDDAGDDSGAAIAARDALIGEYRHSAGFTTGTTRRSVATIARRGAGFAIAWQEDAGNLFGGIGLSLDGIFGAAYTESLNGTFRGSGVVAYRIKGGRLEGFRLARDDGQRLSRETLQGPADLNGRFEIVDSAAGIAGFVEITHQGDTYQMIWQTPLQIYEGVGLRVGDVLIAGYARGFAPAVIAYCVDARVLIGLATYGHSGTVTPDRLVHAGTDGNAAAAVPSARCREAVEARNPTLPQE